MRLRLVLCALLAALGAAAAPAATPPPAHVLIIGDSVATGMLWHKDAIAVMQKGLDVDWDIEICRTISGTSCPFEGERPPTMLEAISSRGTVPPIVVVEMGYNDPAGTFATEVDRAMSALVAAGARHVLWLTLRQARTPYPDLDGILQQAAGRWPQLELLDWDALGAGHTSWFQTDGVHLTDEGGVAMAHLAHGGVLRLVDPLRVPTPLQLRSGGTVSLRLHALGGTAPYRWRVASGRPPHGFHLLANGRVNARIARGAHATFTVSVTDADGSTAKLRVAAG